MSDTVRISSREDITGYRAVFVGKYQIGRMRRVKRTHGFGSWVGFIELYGLGEDHYGSVAELREDAPRILSVMLREARQAAGKDPFIARR